MTKEELEFLKKENKIVLGFLSNFESEKYFLGKLKEDRELRKKVEHGRVSTTVLQQPR